MVWAYFYPSLLAYCLAKLDDVHKAEDAVSEVMTKLLEHTDRNSIRNVGGYLFMIARNHCHSHWATINRHQDLLKKNYAPGARQEEPPAAEELMDAQARDRLMREQLSDRDYQIWMLHMEGYDNKEIAGRLGMNKKTVTNRKSEIRNTLRKIFNGRK